MLSLFQQVGAGLFEEGLNGGYSGNMSVRDGDHIIITRTGSRLHDLTENDLIEVGLAEGPKDKEASTELVVHRAIYQQTKAKAIVHAHPIYATMLSLTESKIIPVDAEGLYYYKSAPIVRVREAIGSQEVAKLLPPIFNSGYVIAVVKGHGSFAATENLEDAYKFTSALERGCMILALSRKPAAPAPQPHRGWEDRKRPSHTGGIPPGIGVMDRSRYRKR